MADRLHDNVFVYKRDDDKFDWERMSPGGDVISGSMNQGYENLGDVMQMAHDLNSDLVIDDRPGWLTYVGKRD